LIKKSLLVPIRLEIQGLRGIAILLVAAYHLNIPYFSGGFIGVDIFFVISGYIITKIILKEIKNNSFSLIKFYEKRIRRILPAYLVVAFITLLASYIFLMPSKLIDFAKALVASLFYISNFFFTYSYNYFFEGSNVSLLHTWSLSIEEQFYIFYPLIFIFLIKIYQKNYLKFFTISLVILTLFSFFLSNYMVFNGFNAIAFYNLPTRIWQLSLGALVFILEEKYIATNLKRNVVFSEFILFFSILSIFFASILMNKNTLHPSFITLIPVSAAGLIIFYSNYSKFFLNILKIKFLCYFGKISYSLYLWHFVIIFHIKDIFGYENETINIFLSIIISILLSDLSYRFIENPFRNKKKISLKITVIFIIFSYLFLIGLSILIYQQKGFSKRTLINNLQLDNEILFREFRDHILIDKNKTYEKNKTKVIIVGDSYGRGFYNFINLNKEIYKNIDVKMFDTLIPECLLKIIEKKNMLKECDNSIDYRIYINHKQNINNFLEADIVIFASSWRNSNLENLEAISQLKSRFPRKKIIIVSKNPEYIFQKSLKKIWLYTDIDFFIDENGKNYFENKNISFEAF
jgi:peptidoglycan/LPS O-acetylase OafA/YrhL